MQHYSLQPLQSAWMNSFAFELKMKINIKLTVNYTFLIVYACSFIYLKNKEQTQRRTKSSINLP